MNLSPILYTENIHSTEYIYCTYLGRVFSRTVLCTVGNVYIFIHHSQWHGRGGSFPESRDYKGIKTDNLARMLKSIWRKFSFSPRKGVVCMPDPLVHREAKRNILGHAVSLHFSIHGVAQGRLTFRLFFTYRTLASLSHTYTASLPPKITPAHPATISWYKHRAR